MLFSPYKLKNLELRNRIVMAPMCTYSAFEGIASDWHIVHYGSRAFGGTGLIILEATGVMPEGRITENDLGLYNDKQIEKLAEIARIIKSGGAAAGIQINHAGRKSKSGALLAPSAIPYGHYPTPKELSVKEIKELVLAFKSAAERAHLAGFDFLEIHGAHGYLINEFLSPLTNKRNDHYGGNEENRLRFLFEVLIAVNEVWPKEKALGLRISAEEYSKGGLSPNDYGEMLKPIKELLDIIDVSSGAVVAADINTFPGYQLDYAKTVADTLKLPVIGGGLIKNVELGEKALEKYKCDLVYYGRKLLSDPYFPVNAAAAANIIFYPKQYERAYK